MFLLHDMLGYILTPWLVLDHPYHVIIACMSSTCYCFISDYITWLLSISWYTCYLIYITIYHAISWHQAWCTDSYNYHDKGNVVPDYCYVLITVMYSWYLITVMCSCYDIAHSLNLIIMLISYNLYGYGRKWWMPEWYLAYSGRMIVYIYMYIYIYTQWCKWLWHYWIWLLLNRGTLGLQSWFQVYGNHYKKWYQFSIYFR